MEHITDNKKITLLQNALISAAVLIGVTGALQSTIETFFMGPVIIAGLLTIAGESAVLAVIPEKIRAVNAALSAAAIIIILMLRDIVFNGFRLLANMIFLTSERNYAYIYDKFDVDIPPSRYALCLGAAFTVISVITAMCCMAAARKKTAVPALFLMFLCICNEVYFGISPHWIWNIVLFGAIGLTMLHASLRSDLHRMNAFISVIFIIIILILSVTTFLLYPESNNPVDIRLTQRAEILRDSFDSKVEQYDSSPASGISDHSGNGSASQDTENKEDTERGYGSGGGSSYIPLKSSSLNMKEVFRNILIIVTATIIFLILPVLIYTRRKELIKRNRAFNSPSDSEAVKAYFGYMIEYLSACGMKTGNVHFSSYGPQIKKITDDNNCEDFMTAVTLWQEAEYSLEPMPCDSINTMRAVTSSIIGKLYSRADFFTRLKIKWYYFL